jgi:hypothetical protein
MDTSKSKTAEAEVTIALKIPLVEDKLSKLSKKGTLSFEDISATADKVDSVEIPVEELPAPAEEILEEEHTPLAAEPVEENVEERVEIPYEPEPSESLETPSIEAPALEKVDPVEETLEEQVLNDSINTLQADEPLEAEVEALPGADLMEEEVTQVEAAAVEPPEAEPAAMEKEAKIEEPAEALISKEEQEAEPEPLPEEPSGSLYGALAPLEEAETIEEVEEEEEEEDESFTDDFIAKLLEAESPAQEPVPDEPVRETAADETVTKEEAEEAAVGELPQDGDYRIKPLSMSETQETQYLLCRKCGTIINVLNAKRNAKCCKQLMVPLEEADED